MSTRQSLGNKKKKKEKSERGGAGGKDGQDNVGTSNDAHGRRERGSRSFCEEATEEANY